MPSWVRFFIPGLICILPFVFYKYNAESPFEIPRLHFSALAVFSVAVFYLAQLGRLRHWKMTLNSGTLWVTATLASALLSYSVSVNRYISLWGDRLLPSECLYSVLAVFVFSLIAQKEMTSQLARFLSVSLIGVLSIEALYGVIQHFKMDPMWWKVYKLTVGTLGSTVAYANYMAALAPFAVYHFLSQKNNFIRLMLALLLGVAQFSLLSSASRTPLVVFLVVTAAQILFHLVRRQEALPAAQGVRKIAGALVLAGALVVGSLMFKVSSANSEIAEKIQAPALSKALETRGLLMKYGIHAWLDRPILGWGPETFSIAERVHQTPELNKYEYWEHPWAKAHNHLVQTLVGTGLLGFSLVILFFFYFSFHALRIFINRSAGDDEQLALAFYFSWISIFLSNLTCFNSTPTQFLYYTAPIVFFSLVKTSFTVRLDWQPKREIAAFSSVGGFFILLLLVWSSFNVWQSDIYYQASRHNREHLQDYLAAADLAQKAIVANPEDPYPHCQSATVISEMLVVNFASLAAEKVDPIMKEIINESETCLQLAGQREHPYFLVGSLWGNLYLHLPQFGVDRALAAFHQLEKFNPNNPRTLERLAGLYRKSGNIEKFLSYSRKAISLKPDFTPAYLTLLEHFYSEKDQKQVDELVDQLAGVTFYSTEFKPDVKKIVELAEGAGDRRTLSKLAP